ncbi:hypothetical protein BDZ45DRAFT_668756 [Acephala macrosclerotiorum]|nr:hypothetical protein BDZ45DRAFT_668756 [Acephala macrosclerotiorum]
MAIENRKPSRTPLPNGVSRKSEHTVNPEDIIQVPSTSPPTVDGDTPPNQMKQSQSQVQIQNAEQYREPQPHNGHSQNGNLQNGHLENGHSQASSHHAEPLQQADEADLSDLTPFDWEDFRRRYTEEIMMINKDEEDLLDEFDKLVASFGWWAECAADRDNERASKRLCTRERFVRLAEESLDEKKRRYEQVVGAFKQALEMLRNTAL